MSKERIMQCETLAKKFTQLDENGKAFIAGYITGRQEGRQERERKWDARRHLEGKGGYLFATEGETDSEAERKVV